MDILHLPLAYIGRARNEPIFPLLNAAASKMLGCMITPPGATAPARYLMPHRVTPLVIVAGDDGFSCHGPDGFPQAKTMMRWAGFVMLHGTGGKPEHYAMAVDAAMLWHRVLLVECRGDFLQAWMDLKARIAPKTKGLILRTPPGAAPHMGEMRSAPAGTVMQ